jgi:hypothetical protein
MVDVEQVADHRQPIALDVAGRCGAEIPVQAEDVGDPALVDAFEFDLEAVCGAAGVVDGVEVGQ